MSAIRIWQATSVRSQRDCFVLLKRTKPAQAGFVYLKLLSAELLRAVRNQAKPVVSCACAYSYR